MQRVSLLAVLIAGLSLGCQGGSGPIDGGEPGCPNFLYYDAGAIGSAAQVLPVVTAAAKAWNPALVMTGLQGKLSPDGTDVDGGWTFTYGSPTVPGLGTIQPFATHTIVAGQCDFPSSEPSIRDFRIDSSVALAVAADAGCVLGPIVPVRLAGVGDPSSPLFNIDPAWLINARTPDGGPVVCVVDADKGTFGVPPDGGTGDGG